MKTSITVPVVLAAALFFNSNAMAGDNLWFGVKAGTLGLGVEAAWHPIPWLDFRVGANKYDYDDSGSVSGINYDATLALQSYYLTGNFRFPVSPFRMTVGAFSNGNEVQMVGRPAQAYLIGNNPIPYTAAAQLLMHGSMTLPLSVCWVQAVEISALLQRPTLPMHLLLQRSPLPQALPMVARPV